MTAVSPLGGTPPLTRAGARTAIRVDVTPRAARQVRSLLAARAGEQYGLRVSVDQTQAGGTAYRLSLAPQPHPDDLVLTRNGFDVFAPQEHRDRLDGVRIDFVESPTSAGFVVDPPAWPLHPRRPWIRGTGSGDGGSGEGGSAGPDGVPEGLAPAGRSPDPGRAVPGPPEVVAAVEASIAQVRPALQADGGDLGLVAVEGRTAYVALAGACSGCPSVLITLTDLVERVVVDAVPAVDRVVLAS
jgi:iron-sulfur cluster assembly accessory protein